MIISLVLWLIMGALNAYFAYKRGRDPIAWFMIGILLGILGLGILFLLPKLEPVRHQDPEFALGETALLDTSDDYTKKEWYFVDEARQQQGPIEFNSLKAKWSDGSINGGSLVWSEGMQEWILVSELPGFKEILAN